MYFSPFVYLQISKMMRLSVEQVHSRAGSLVAEFQRGETSYIEEAIDLDREALELSSWPLGQPKRYRNHTGPHRGLIIAREALNLHPRGHPDRPYVQLVLSSIFLSLGYGSPWLKSTNPTLLLAYETYLRLLIQHLAALPLLPQHHVISKTSHLRSQRTYLTMSS